MQRRDDSDRRSPAAECTEPPDANSGKPFDIDTPWFGELLSAIGQPKGEKVDVEH